MVAASLRGDQPIGAHASPDVHGQLAAFEQSWQDLSQALSSAAAIGTRPKPADGWNGGPFLTLVVPLTDELSAHITLLHRRLKPAADGHYVYPPATVHLTILDYTALCTGRTPVGCHDVCQIAAVCGAVFQAHRPFRLTGLGLNLSPFTVCVQLLTEQDELARLRRALLVALGEHFPTVSVTPPRFGWPQLACANIIRFQHGEQRVLVTEVAQLRTVSFGSMVVDGADLVITDKVLTPEQTTTCARLALQRNR